MGGMTSPQGKARTVSKTVGSGCWADSLFFTVNRVVERLNEMIHVIYLAECPAQNQPNNEINAISSSCPFLLMIRIPARATWSHSSLGGHLQTGGYPIAPGDLPGNPMAEGICDCVLISPWGARRTFDCPGPRVLGRL